MGFCLELKGEFACFTRAELKVERVSYDVITPSAARAIFESILWKPAIKWHINKIEVLKPIRWTSIRRNELGSVLPVRNIYNAMKGREMPSLLIEEQRQQRAGLLLKDVAYRIHANYTLTHKASVSENSGKFSDMFKRRAKKGQCFNQPYLGCREFSCDFRLVENDEDNNDAINETKPLGWMLYDLDYSDKPNPKPLFFNATMNNGVINVPDRTSPEVKG